MTGGRVVWALLGLILFSPGSGWAQEACEPPVSICRPPLLPHLGPGIPEHVCPPGSTCRCVPSCPICLDCAVGVCVLDGRPECQTACDCPPGLGCFQGKCVAGFAPVFCCEGRECPAGQQCQHGDGRNGRCADECTEVWMCPADLQCGPGRVCSCTASCPLCQDCGPGTCVVEGAATPYRCGPEGECANPGDRCVCASSCPGCDDCVQKVCVAACDGPSCQERVDEVTRRIGHIVKRASECRHHRECVQIQTSTRCMGTCGAWVNAHHEHRVERIISRIDRRICRSFQEDGCPFATPGCLFERGACVDGRCRGVPVLPIPAPSESDLGILDVPTESLLDPR